MPVDFGKLDSILGVNLDSKKILDGIDAKIQEKEGPNRSIPGGIPTEEINERIGLGKGTSAKKIFNRLALNTADIPFSLLDIGGLVEEKANIGRQALEAVTGEDLTPSRELPFGLEGVKKRVRQGLEEQSEEFVSGVEGDVGPPVPFSPLSGEVGAAALDTVLRLADLTDVATLGLGAVAKGLRGVGALGKSVEAVEKASDVARAIEKSDDFLKPKKDLLTESIIESTRKPKPIDTLPRVGDEVEFRRPTDRATEFDSGRVVSVNEDTGRFKVDWRYEEESTVHDLAEGQIYSPNRSANTIELSPASKVEEANKISRNVRNTELRRGPVFDFTNWLQGKTTDLLRSDGRNLRAARQYSDPEQRKFVSKDLPNMFRRLEGRISSESFKANNIRDRLSSEIVDYASQNKITVQEVGQLLDKSRREGKIGDISNSRLRKAAKEASDFIDRLSKRFLDAGILTKEQAKTFERNLGSYLNLSHEAFDVPNYIERVRGTATWEKMFQLLKKENPDMPDDEIVGIMNSLADRKIRSRVEPGDRVTQDFSELIQRKEIHPVVREFLGLRTDMLANFTRSASLMIHDLEKTRFLRTLRESGLESGAFSPTKSNDLYVPVFFGKENDLVAYTSPETARLLDSLQETSRSNFITFLNGATKFGKVGLSPQTQFRNFESGILMSMAGGHLLSSPIKTLKRLGRAARITGRTVFGTEKSNRLLNQRVERALELNVLNSGANSRELALYAKQISDYLAKKSGGKLISRITAKMGVPLRATLELAKRAYLAGDDFWKFLAWESEIDDLSRIVKTDADRSALRRIYGTDNVEEVAAEVISGTMQTYSRSAPLAKTLSRFPLFGAFATFNFEMPRNLKNVVKMSARDFRMAKETGNARWAAKGTKRLAGMVTALTSFTAWKEYQKYQKGISNEQEEALRRLGYPWSQNNDLVILDVDGSKVTYADGGFMDPYNNVKSLFVAALSRPGTMEERADRLVEQLEDLYLGHELFIGAAVEQLFNRKLSGEGPISGMFGEEGLAGPVYNPEDPALKQFKDRMHRLFRQVGPGGAVTAERILRGSGILEREVGSREYKFKDEVMALFGPRQVTLDMSDALKYRSWRFDKRRINLAKSVNEDLEDAGQDPNKRAEIIRQAEERWSDIYQEMQEDVDAAKLWNVSPSRVVEVLRDQGISKKIATSLANGEYLYYFGGVKEFP